MKNSNPPFDAKLVSSLLIEYERQNRQLCKKKKKTNKGEHAPSCVVEPQYSARRDRKFCLTTYIDKNALIKFLSNAEWVQHWAICTHDKDLNDDGTIKTLHTHIVLTTHCAKTNTAVQKIFDRLSTEIYGVDNMQNTFAMYCFDLVAQYRYLLHLDDKSKYQYEHIERIADDEFYWQKLENTAGSNGSENVALSIFIDLCNGVSTYEMICRWGKDFVYHLPMYERAVQRHQMEIGANDYARCKDVS